MVAKAAIFAFIGLSGLGLPGCAPAAAPHPYPEAEREAFFAMCGGGEAFCACAWDGITRALTAEEWAQSQADLEATGHPHPQIVLISASCREKTHRR